MSDKPDRKTQPPVSAHPAFPVIVALWFAALLGIGSLVLPIAVFERYALASGLADAFLSAHPPLGATARLIIALGGAGIGAVLGFAVARRIAAAHAARPAARTAAAAEESESLAKRPISAHEELFEGGFDAGEPELAPDETTTRPHRALALGRESAPSEFPTLAPLPGESRDDDEGPLDLQVFAEEAVAPSSPVPDAEPADEEPEDRAFAAPVSERPLGELGMVELVERFAIALQRHRAAERPAAEAVLSQAEFTAPAAVSAPPVAIDDAGASALPGALRPLEFDHEPGDEEREEAAALPESDLADWGDSEPGHGDESEDECAAHYPSLLAMKGSLGASREPVRLETDDANSVDEPVLVFPGQMLRPAMPASGGEGANSSSFDAALARAESAAQAANQGGSHKASSDHAETERALRDALEKLQRLSGAA